MKIVYLVVKGFGILQSPIFISIFE